MVNDGWFGLILYDDDHDVISPKYAYKINKWEK